MTRPTVPVLFAAVAYAAMAFPTTMRAQACTVDAPSVAACATLAQQQPDNADAALAYGQALDRAHKTRDALDEYRRFTVLQPRDPRGYELVGWTELQLGHLDDALQSFRASERLSPNRSSVRYGAALTLKGMGRHEEALRELTAAATLDPLNGTLWGEMALASSTLGRTGEAESEWERALQLDPGFFDTRPQDRRAWEKAIGQVGKQQPASLTAQAPMSVPVAAPVAVTEATSRVTTPHILASDGPQSSGSGFAVAQGGYILTNKHVVRGCNRLTVRVDSASVSDATVVAEATGDDLALLRAPKYGGAIATFRDTPSVRAGEDVVAVGFPLSGLLADQVNVTTGAISALAGMYNDRRLLQMTAPVQHGSSGGPLFDNSGHVIGIVVTKLNARIVAEETGDIPQNVNFAVRAEQAQIFLAAQQVPFRKATSSGALSNADVGDEGRKVTVLVECWK